MVLFDHLDRDRADRVRLAHLQRAEADFRPQPVERHRERNILLLAAQRGFGIGVARMDHDLGGGVEHRHEEREAANMVPVQVRQEHMINARVAPGAAPHRIEPEFAQARPKIADDERIVRPARLDFDAAGGAAVRAERGEIELGFSKSARFGHVGKAAALGGDERGRDLVAHSRGLLRHRQRTARTPEPHLHCPTTPSSPRGTLSAQTAIASATLPKTLNTLS